MKFDDKTYRLTETGNSGRNALIVGVVLLLVSAVGYFQDTDHFFLAYLTSFVFWLTIALGALFFTMVQHLTGAKWSVVVRRLSESIAATMPVLVILFIPLLFGIGRLYHWSHADAVAADELLQSKSPYLNVPFFVIRAVFYFAVWVIVARLLLKTSLAQDAKPDERLITRMRRISAPGMVLFAVTITFASFDWLMSLDAHWFSTIFGVYIFSGAFLAALCFMIMMGILLNRHGVLTKTITVEHYHDLAKLAFGFIIFWAYMAFSQYFLIWYANLPEENYWFLYRWDNSWKAFSLVIIFGHFVIPFLGLITRAAKRSAGWLMFMTVWILAMHWVDMYWLVMPTHYRDGMHFSWMDITTLFGLGGIFLWYFWKQYSSHSLVPVNDPALETSIKFTNG